MFEGVSTLSLDAKGRLAVPARHRSTLEECCASRVAVTVNPMAGEPCLWLYPEGEWREVVRTLEGLPAFDPQAQAMRRFMIGYASPLELDAQGRIKLSAEQCKFAGLDKRIALVGQGRKFEIWDEQAWTRNQPQWQSLLVNEEGQLSPALQGLVL